MGLMVNVMTVAVADALVKALQPGASFVYYRGFIAKDRCTFPEARARAVGALADLMLRHGCQPDYVMGHLSAVNGTGAGVICQRRHGPMDYEYIFTKL